jgi:L-ascorbate metabolism protein UlaG (beta-lactamase superfamily)
MFPKNTGNYYLGGICMKIKYLGHASFLITSQDNKKIVIDPYSVGHGISYGEINETADIVTVSHAHGDHNNSASIKGSPTILHVAGTKTIKGIDIKGTPVFHDEAQGSKRGNNLIFCFNIDGMKLCHLGDLGHTLGPKQLSEIGPVDILLVPVGGFFTIDAREATTVAESVGAKVVIPMHYKTAKADYPIKPVDDFLLGKKNIRKLDSSEAEYTKETLPEKAEIVVLQPAL